MRYYSINILLIITLVLNFVRAAPHTDLKPRPSPTQEEDSLDSIADPIRIDSMSITEVENPKPPTPRTSHTITQSKFIKSTPKNELLPQIGFYSGPTATDSNANSALYGLQLNSYISENESYRFGLAYTSQSQGQLILADQFQLTPRPWGHPYWNLHLMFLIDPNAGMSSFTNIKNYGAGFTLGAKINSHWLTEFNIEPLSLKGFGVGFNLFYLIAL